MKILLTGAGGFIGFHTATALLNRGDTVIGIDNLNEYYDKNLKLSRLEKLKHKNFQFHTIDIADHEQLLKIFEDFEIDKVCHLAAQAGVRYSIDSPTSYEESNVRGTFSLFEAAKKTGIMHIVMSSTSSVYGDNEIPYKESMIVDNPLSVYAATKRGCELIGQYYSKVHQMKVTMLRLFTVYGPWGRPDMATFKFTKSILADEPIDVYNKGDMLRDFTYVSDIVHGVLLALDKEFDFEVINLGASSPVRLMDFIEYIETALGCVAKKNFLPIQPGEMQKTHADISKARQLLGYDPIVRIDEGIKNFVEWYKEYYK